MDPLTMAAVSFGLDAIGSGLGFMGQQDAARQNNKAIQARNEYAVQQHAYGEAVKNNKGIVLTIIKGNHETGAFVPDISLSLTRTRYNGEF